MTKLYRSLSFALCMIVALVLTNAAFARTTRIANVYQVHLPIIAQDSPWREPDGFAGNCAGGYENRERHGWYCARAERLPDRVRVYGAAVVNGSPVRNITLTAIPEGINSWCSTQTDERGLTMCDVKHLPAGPVTLRAFIGNAGFKFEFE